MNRELAVRALGLYTPIAVSAALWVWRRHLALPASWNSRRVGAAVLLASAWNAPALLTLHLASARNGWWTFHADGGTFAGIPIDLFFGWLVLWGAVPILAFGPLPIPVVAVAMVTLDLVLMPLCAPVVELGSSWLIGEAVAAGVVLVPAQCLARWTLNDTSLPWRAALQVIAFSGLLLLVIPSAVLQQTGGDWRPLLDRSARWNAILAQIIAIPAVIGVSAVQEFVTRGRGTPIPFDPPRQLVTTGPYAFVANPMQLGTALVFLFWAVMLSSLWMTAAVVVTIAYSAGIATWDEERDLGERFGEPWIQYRRAVRQWWPRWKPFIAEAIGDCEGSANARLYVAQTCATCRGVGAWLTAQGVTGLEIAPAELHPTRTLFRLTYESPDGARDEGVAAFARALEHINLGWAWCGMLMRLPLINQLLQIIVDASGGYARPAQQAR